MQTVQDQQKQSKLKTSNLTFKESLMGACTNFMYRLGAIRGIPSVPRLLKLSSKNSIVFGEVIDDKAIVKQRLLRIIWFTYREKLMIAEGLNSDVGWGCMPRVGQMMLAQALSRHLSCKEHTITRQKCLQTIIQPFLDDDCEDNCGYSLSTILKYARRRFGLVPGDWFNIGILSDVLRKIQDEHPLKGTEDLKIVFFSQSVIFVSQMEEASSVNKCQCGKHIFFCENCNQFKLQEKQVSKEMKGKRSETQDDDDLIDLGIPFSKTEGEKKMNFEIYDESNEEEWNSIKNPKTKKKEKSERPLKNSLVVIIAIRTAEKYIDKCDADALISLLSLPTSLGIIGGVPSKALYIVGSEDHQMIYLDPHYVQEHVDRHNLLDNLHTFFCPEYRTISIDALDPSMALCFYLHSFQDVEGFLMAIKQIQTQYEKENKSFFISLMNEQEFNDKNSNEEIQKSFEYNSMEFRDITDSY